MATFIRPEHITSDVRELARTACAKHSRDVPPILADALADAGYDNADALNELRAERVFGRSPGAAPVGEILMAILGVRVERLPDEDGRSGRIRVRKVSGECLFRRAVAEAVFLGRSWQAKHGGGVANAYKYPASTEAVLCAAVYDAAAGVVRAKLWAGELPANKVTLGGVTDLFGFRAMGDDRYGPAAKAFAAAMMYGEVAAVPQAS